MSSGSSEQAESVRGRFIRLQRELAEQARDALGPEVAAGVLRFAADVVEDQARARGDWDAELYAGCERGNTSALAQLSQTWATRRRDKAHG
jgi:hypothetical protein